MWILLEEGDEIHSGDEWLSCHAGWSALPATYVGHVKRGDVFRRKLTGWAAVTHALKAEVLGNDKEGCETTPRFWSCKCAMGHVHESREPADADQCPRCLAINIASADARKAEVILEIIEEK